MTGVLPRIDDSNWSPEIEAGFGALETMKGPLPLKAMDVKARITGLLYDLDVVQTFVNTHAEPIEAVYIFPLPPRAAVSGFSMKVGNHLVIGELKERGAARRGYQQALAAGKRASLAEEDRPNVFTLSVGNLMPGDCAEVSFRLNGILTLNGDQAEWRFPLVVAPRYIPGTPLEVEAAGLGVDLDTDEVPDASRLNPPVLLKGFPNPVHLGIEVELDPCGLGFTDLCSTLHAVDIEREEGSPLRRIRLAYEERLNLDFVLRFRLPGGALQCSAVLIPDTENPVPEREVGDATLMVTLLPPQPDRSRQTAKDVVFVLDRSGSMAGWKITAARRAMARMVDTLGPEDRFGIIAFDTGIETMGLWARGLVAATDPNRFKAAEFLAKVEADGGTQMLSPIKMALKALAGGADQREKILFLVTDGQVGNEGRMVQEAQKQHVGCRFQIIGIGDSANDSLLQRMATVSKGWFMAAESDRVLDGMLVEAARAFGRPLVTGLQLKAPGLFPQHIVSSGSMDLYAGTPLILLGRSWSSRALATVSLEGEGEGEGRAPFQVRLATHSADSTGVRRVWARWKMRDMEDAQKNASDIIGVSLAHGVLCRNTAFLAVDERGPVNLGGRPVPLIQPVEDEEDGPDVSAMSRGVSNLCLPSVMRCSKPLGGTFEEDSLNVCYSIRGGLSSADPGLDDSVEEDLGVEFDLGCLENEGLAESEAPSPSPAMPSPAVTRNTEALQVAGDLLDNFNGASLGQVLAHLLALVNLAERCKERPSSQAFLDLRRHMGGLFRWLLKNRSSGSPALDAFLDLSRRMDRMKPNRLVTPDPWLELAEEAASVCADLHQWLLEAPRSEAPVGAGRRFWEAP